ncbi:TPA: hypothetical protein DCP77_01430 [Candidatus Collierbacteria bacterium]|uniref:Peptidase M56 domain-containing protein n=1 Tax=Candidatus Collierbacteria bacterium GW2011_GWA2_42_17 TaxID=1618378 RepID=A0A0G0Z2K4_9BACT|nr:MAG: hypothetical protein UU94_C0003G0053 [Candidatus Collierbacteria bacterium GW2011_GWB2_42_12]KKS43009.1 MAG: hypothetical protein UV06_C0003G0010 [Candidatus Collierbacteria bacterium GW2011_GWA2_42_17]KKS62539.1 MAG: hypothetical protein UV28_C0009G0015 [Candidatus Collierbacteria bacterium GW2011_GWE2_42_48]KKS64841.1 MAG: hypothetical protein UV32_C0005G0012 [Candidatus Collierbacteria bacterium GW2011_GWF2_42_51]KKS68059.1 MAG: hypothetical protein UV37_C0001G0012 [Candidatus Collie
MNYRKLNSFSNLFFVFLVFVGLIYTVFLFKLFLDTSPGLVMLLIFLMDAIRYGYSMVSIQSLGVLLVSSLISITTQVLIYRYIKALLMTLKIVGGTRHFTKSLELVSIKDKIVTFSSSSIRAFTSGLLHPRIHLPKNLKETNSSLEVKAIMLHEKQHTLAFDPFKSWVVGGIKEILPGFPFKKWIFGHYDVLVELTADAYAEKILNKRLPIISALYKQYEGSGKNIIPAVGFSNSQSERIHILVGKERVKIKGPLVVSSVVVMTLFVGTLLTRNKDLFYSCPHLDSCILNVIAQKTSNFGVSEIEAAQSVLGSHQ